MYGGLHLRGSIILKAILREVLEEVDRETTEVNFVGSSAGAVGTWNHIQWVVDEMKFQTHLLTMILDSFYAPVSQVTPDDVRVRVCMIIFPLTVCVVAGLN